MVQKTVWVPELGELTLSKRRGAKNLRLSISATGKLRVGMPLWAPYAAGIQFALQRKDWIKKHTAAESRKLSHGSRIGKSHRLRYSFDPARKTVLATVSNGLVSISAPWPLEHSAVQSKISQAADKALKKEAETLLPQRLAVLARNHGYRYKDVRIRKLTSRWGSCSSDKIITLNFFLMQLPWPLIDYVILHELVHTKHLNHSAAFWQEFDSIYPGAKNYRKQLKKYQPMLADQESQNVA
ncbi:MAG TPA: SprT family zinc-dependent metalloprotease [Candidatus Saccharimonadales bacterium]|nr:SprT family zinc-dependent metalloprotease [Candidatus Saccharimonadales bacterium]